MSHLILTMILAVISPIAMSCPQLADIYLACKSSSDIVESPMSQIITQQVIDGKTVYEIVDDNLDRIVLKEGQNVTQREDFPDMDKVDMVIEARPTCNGSDLEVTPVSLRVERRAGSMESDEEIQLATEMMQVFIGDSKTVYRRDANSNLVIEEYLSGDILNTITCTKF